jgi:hypothetical protein
MDKAISEFGCLAVKIDRFGPDAQVTDGEFASMLAT